MEEVQTNIKWLDTIQLGKQEYIFFDSFGDGKKISLNKIVGDNIQFNFDFVTVPENSMNIGGVDNAMLYLNRESGKVLSVNIISKEVSDTHQTVAMKDINNTYRAIQNNRYYYTLSYSKVDGYTVNVVDLFKGNNCQLSKTKETPDWDSGKNTWDLFHMLQKSSQKFELVRYYPWGDPSKNSFTVIDTETCKEFQLSKQFPPYIFAGRGGISHLDEGFYLSWENGNLRLIDIKSGTVIDSAEIPNDRPEGYFSSIYIPKDARIVESFSEDKYRVYSY